MRCLLFACLLLGSFPSFALDRFQVEGYTLRNGLQMLLKPGAWLYGWAMQAAGQASSGMPLFALAGSLLVYLWYFTATCRCCYDSRWPMAVLQGLAVFAALAAANIWIYRPVQFLLSLWAM